MLITLKQLLLSILSIVHNHKVWKMDINKKTMYFLILNRGNKFEKIVFSESLLKKLYHYFLQQKTRSSTALLYTMSI